ncbi:MAG: zf-HC2 domain-containing protein [Nakamurella sp.]
MIDHTQAQLSLGAYVLGALDAGDRNELEEHLAECTDCRREVVSFAGLPGLMGRVTLAEVRQHEQEPTPSARLQASTVAAIRSEQQSSRRTVRRWRVIAGGGLAAAVAACTALILVLTTSTPATVDAATVRQNLTAAAGTSASGSLSLLSKTWGTQVHVVLADLPRTGAFTVRTIDDSGRQSTAATWQATPSGRAELTGATSSQIDDIERVEIVTDAGVTVLSNR